MYEKFFGLQERPFDLAPNPKYLFLSTSQREVLSTLRYALSGPRGLALLLGEAGTGKTTLVQTALSEIGGSVECALVSNPTLTRDEFYEFLGHSFGLNPDEWRSKARFLLTLRHRVEERHAAGKVTAVLIDEAQSLPYDLLEEVRLLSNIETQTTKLLSVVLAGQPELATRLNDPQLRQLKQRIALRCELSVLDLAATAAYVAGRLRIAGGSPAEIFTRNAIDAVWQAAGGVPRIINVICDNALIGGFATQTKPVTRALVEEVIRDFDLGAAREAGASAELRLARPAGVSAAADAIHPSRLPAGAEEPSEPSLLRAVGHKRRFSFF